MLEMAKLKPAGKKKQGPAMERPGMVPCVVIILTGMALLSMLFYAALSSGGR